MLVASSSKRAVRRWELVVTLLRVARGALDEPFGLTVGRTRGLLWVESEVRGGFVDSDGPEEKMDEAFGLYRGGLAVWLEVRDSADAPVVEEPLASFRPHACSGWESLREDTRCWRVSPASCSSGRIVS